ncbi:MAG: hypothetical protein ACHBN1_06620 [Heteroscytonema crispum UTEX LB 1556]
MMSGCLSDFRLRDKGEGERGERGETRGTRGMGDRLLDLAFRSPGNQFHRLLAEVHAWWTEILL